MFSASKIAFMPPLALEIDTTMPKAAALAIVTGGSLVKMQVRRLFTQPYARVTHTPQAGRAWVLQGVEPAASPAPSGHPAPPAIARA